MIKVKQETQPATQVDRIEKTPPVGVKWHPYAELFPWIDGPAFEELKADIAKNGVLEPVVFLGDAILDGRNRYMAARDLGVEYPRVEYTGDDPLAFVLAKNLARRHLTDRQRADVAAKLARLPRGRPSENPSIEGITVAEAAKVMDVPVAAVERSKVIQENAAPELKAAYEAGEVSQSAAAEVARLPKEEQAKVVAEGKTADAAKEQREQRKAARKAEQEKNEAARKALADQFSPEVKRQQEYRARAIEAKQQPDDEIQDLRDRIAELEDANRSLEKDNAELTERLKTYDHLDLMYRDWKEGGWEKVVQAKDDTIAELQRTAQTRIAAESAEKVRNLNAMRSLAKKLDDAGLGRDIYIDLNEPANG